MLGLPGWLPLIPFLQVFGSLAGRPFAESASLSHPGCCVISGRGHGSCSLDKLRSAGFNDACRLGFHSQRLLASRQTGDDTTFGGLPANLVPRHYNLTVEPDNARGTFDGKVIIDLDVVKDTTEAVFNSLNLTMTSIVMRVIKNGILETEL